MTKVLVIGLDCATPQHIFGEYLEYLPNIRKILENGLHAKMRSSNPPITIPAWLVMATSRNPGALGLYGFRHRKNYSYTDIWIANSYEVRKPAVWDILSDHGKKCIIIGVPPSYPPKPLNGYLITDFITPGPENEYTYPPELKSEIQEKFGDYIFDVEFRTDKKRELSENLYKMVENHFEIIKYMLKNKPWDLFWFVEIGTDRVNHGFWHFADKNHKKYQKGSGYENFIKDFHVYIDREIGELLKLIDKETIVLMVSDHGAKAMKGRFSVNDWLINNNYLTLNSRPPPKTTLRDADINWSKTKAWGWGGYYARIFLNVKEREELGTIDMKDYEKERDILIEKIKNIKDPSGNPMKTNVFKVEDIFPELKGNAPDLMVYFDDLSWRSAGTIGHNSPYLEENGLGPDEAVHDYFGIFAMYDPLKKVGKNISEVNILDIAPTILNLFNILIPEEMEGQIIRIEEYK